MYKIIRSSDEELIHHGILGQKWGIRRYQNKDGSLTPAGRKRYLNTSGEIELRPRRGSYQGRPVYGGDSKRRNAEFKKVIETVEKNHPELVENYKARLKSLSKSDTNFLRSELSNISPVLERRASETYNKNASNPTTENTRFLNDASEDISVYQSLMDWLENKQTDTAYDTFKRELHKVVTKDLNAKYSYTGSKAVNKIVGDTYKLYYADNLYDVPLSYRKNIPADSEGPYWIPASAYKTK